jgi:Mrp family chromosome partitioning ATPase
LSREGVREGVTIVAASVAACAAGAAGLSLVGGDEGWEATAVVADAPPREPLRSAEVARRALDAAGAGGEGARELLDHMETARAGREATFTVRAEEPAAARRLAEDYARAWAEAARRSAGASAVVRAGPAEPTPERAMARAALIGAAIGLLVGLLLAFLRERLDVRRTSSRTMAARLGLRELGAVPEAPEGVEDAYRLPALDSRDGSAAYERLAARVAAAARDASAKVVAVRGTVAEDRGEQVAAGLAAALAADGRTVAVVELDPARPALRRQFALARRPGASEVARGKATLDEALADVPGVSGLSVLTAGAAPAPQKQAAERVLDSLRERFGTVVVAAPPLLGTGEGPVGVDALLLVVALRRIRHSRRPLVERVLDDLEVPVLGFVLMASAQRAPDLAAGGHHAGHHDRHQHQ